MMRAIWAQTLDKASSISSRSSRHTRGSSVASIERPNSPPLDSTGLAMMSGVITSIPYDSVAADSKSPIPVDYLPRSDQMPVRRDPLPHHLNKGGGDFHQYPSFDPASLSNPNSNLTGPRPPPGATNVTMATTGNRTTQLQQWGPGSRSTVSTVNGGAQPRDTIHPLHIILQITPEAQLTNRVLPQEPKGQAYSLQAVLRGQQCLLRALKYPLLHPIHQVESLID